MLRDFIARLKIKATKIACAIIEKLGAAIRTGTPSESAVAGVVHLIVSTETKDAMHAGKRYRLTSGHAPIFSLFTFFTLRQ